MMNKTINGLMGLVNTLIRARSSAQIVFQIIDLQPDIPLDDGIPASFSVSVQTVVLVCGSVAETTTIVHMLHHLHDFQGGELLIGGRLT